MKNVIEFKPAQHAKTKQGRINQLGEKLKDLFLNTYGYTPWDSEHLPETIEFEGIELGLSINGHEDCPRYNYDLTYYGEIEDENIAIYIEYYRASVIHSITVQNIYVEKDEPEFSFEYKMPADLIAQTMIQIMEDELELIIE
ncbi:hypothetical protein ABH916_003438 [Peribacillus frigoritolerans]|uniref:hypothetical protein n=1 Tax=Peribacillus frigoritolerans TaxID=450367 RepID=UPI0038348E22